MESAPARGSRMLIFLPKAHRNFAVHFREPAAACWRSAWLRLWTRSTSLPPRRAWIGKDYSSRVSADQSVSRRVSVFSGNTAPIQVALIV